MRKLRLAVFVSLFLPALAVAPVFAEPAEVEEPVGGEGHGEGVGASHGDEHGEATGAHGSEHGGAHAGGDLNVADVGYWWQHRSEGASPPLLFALINFALLLLILRKLAVPSIRTNWASKSDAIRDGLEEGARLRREAEAKLEEYTKRIADVDGEVESLISEIRAEAAEERQRIAADADAQAAATKLAAEERIAAAIAQARREIEHEVISKAVAAATTLLRERVQSADHENLTAGFIASLDSERGAANRSST